MGQLLINIHGQHDHQLITKAVEQRNILDQYATHHDLIENVKHYYNKHKELTREYDLLLESKIQRDAKQQLLQYQVNELNEFSIQQGEFESLEIEYTKQSNGQHILNQALQTLQILSDDEQFNVVDQLRRIAEQLSQLSVLDKSLTPLVEQVNSALIQTEDAASELTHYYERLELDPQGYQVIEERYSQIIQLAKSIK